MLKVRVSNMIGFNGNAVRNQFEIDTDDGIYFQSYSTVIACKRDGEVILDPEWDYSVTTTKYLSKFLRTSSKREIEAKIKSGEYTIEGLN